MFNKDFYPTPDDVIEVMIQGLELNGKFVLEPSAGSGNILDYVSVLGAKTLACEKDPELSKIAMLKTDNFLGYDFLEVTSEMISHADYIIMNPPFSADEKHILHAWEIAPDGCVIKALCNWETLDNTYSSYRKCLLSLTKENGYSENIGHAFSKADRETGIEVGLVTLFKPKNGEGEFEGFFDLTEDYEEQSNGIVQYNELRDIVNRYVGAVKMFDEVIEKAGDINSMASPFNSYNNIRFGAYAYNESNQFSNITRETYKKELQKAAWKTVFSKLGMEKYVTQSVKDRLNKFVEKQTNVPFKLSNVYKMVDMLIQTYGQNMDKAIIEVFDKITMHHKENRYNVEGWVSNSQYMINQKIVFPHGVNVGWSGQLEAPWNGRSTNTIDDLCKALCYLTGKKYDHSNNLHEFYRIGITEEDENGKKVKIGNHQFGQWYNWEFFEIRGYKKGTLHMKFKDESVWAMLNQRIAKIKGWGLPESFNRKKK